jgi:hypothetical protein
LVLTLLSLSAVETAPFPYGSNPKTVKEAWPPTYTLPLATVGTVNFTAPPAEPEPVLGLLKSKVETLLASYASRIALPVVPQAERSRTQTMPLVVPLAETAGVAPRGGNVLLETADCGVAIVPFEIVNWLRGKFCPVV